MARRTILSWKISSAARSTTRRLRRNPDKPVDPPPDGHNGTRTKYYASEFSEAHNIGFTKRRVAEAVKRLSVQGAADEETKENLRKITDAISNALEQQTGEPAQV